MCHRCLFLSMNNFLADGWLVGDSKQQAFSWFSLRCQSWITCTVLNSAQRLLACSCLFSNCVLTFLSSSVISRCIDNCRSNLSLVPGAWLSDFNAWVKSSPCILIRNRVLLLSTDSRLIILLCLHGKKPYLWYCSVTNFFDFLELQFFVNGKKLRCVYLCHIVNFTRDH